MKWRDDERRLFEAGRELEDEASTSRERLLLGFATSSAVSLAAASVKAAIALETKLALGAASSAGLTLLAKATIAGGAIGVAAGAVADAIDAPPADEPPPNRTTAVQAPAREGAEASRAPDRATPLDDDESRAAEPTASAAPKPEPAIAAPPAARVEPGGPDPSSTARALAALDDAKRAVEAGDAAGAARALADYDASRGGGALDPEAALLRLRVLQLSGHRAEAAALARQWLAQQPNTPVAGRLRQIAQENP
ncbi:MAG: hypothetical protein R3B72_37070 [Polyangiaceae bacterium]